MQPDQRCNEQEHADATSSGNPEPSRIHRHVIVPVLLTCEAHASWVIFYRRSLRGDRTLRRTARDARRKSGMSARYVNAMSLPL